MMFEPTFKIVAENANKAAHDVQVDCFAILVESVTCFS